MGDAARRSLRGMMGGRWAVFKLGFFQNCGGLSPLGNVLPRLRESFLAWEGYFSLGKVFFPFGKFPSCLGSSSPAREDASSLIEQNSVDEKREIAQ